jgi:hypothetical protein
MAQLQQQDSLHNHELQIRRKSGQTYAAIVSVEQLELESGPGVLTIIRER